jgi:hypothetical protein
MNIQQPRFVDGRSLAVDLQTPAKAIAGGLTQMFDNQRQEQQAMAKQQQLQEQQRQMQNMQDTYTDLSSIRSLAPEKRGAFINQRMAEYKASGDPESAQQLSKLLGYIDQGNIDSFIDPKINMLASQLGIKGEGESGGYKDVQIIDGQYVGQNKNTGQMEAIPTGQGASIALANQQQKSAKDKEKNAQIEAQKTAFTQAGSLRKEYESIIKPYRQTVDSYATFEALKGADQELMEDFASGFGAFADPSVDKEAIMGDAKALNDIALIFAFFKMVDPTSTVREGEFANVESAGGVETRFRNMYNRLLNGGRLNDAQRNQIERIARKKNEGALKRVDSAKNKYTKLGNASGVNLQQVFIDDQDSDFTLKESGDVDYSALEAKHGIK